MRTFPLQSIWLRQTFSRTRRRLTGESAVGSSTVAVGTISVTGITSVTGTTSATGTTAKRRQWWAKAALSASYCLAAVSIVLATIFFAPDLYFRLLPPDTVPVQALEDGTAFGGAFAQGDTPSRSIPVPPQDDSLPEGIWLVISRIGVRTQVLRSDNTQDALIKGVWMVPDFGQAGDENLPVILAAHRYGWQWWWKTDYWKYNSFYLLPELQPGDRVELISDQRKWVYEIYAGDEGEEITDYEADLILYTCKFLNSPVRHFRYARLIDPTQATQE